MGDGNNQVCKWFKRSGVENTRRWSAKWRLAFGSDMCFVYLYHESDSLSKSNLGMNTCGELERP